MAALVTNLGYLKNTTPNNYTQNGYVLLYQRDNATNTFKRYKVLLTPTNITTKLNKVAISGQYAVAAAFNEPVNGVEQRGSIFIWKHADSTGTNNVGPASSGDSGPPDDTSEYTNPQLPGPGQ
jgi:hypothetical protein